VAELLRSVLLLHSRIGIHGQVVRIRNASPFPQCPGASGCIPVRTTNPLSYSALTVAAVPSGYLLKTAPHAVNCGSSSVLVERLPITARDRHSSLANTPFLGGLKTEPHARRYI